MLSYRKSGQIRKKSYGRGEIRTPEYAIVDERRTHFHLYHVESEPTCPGTSSSVVEQITAKGIEGEKPRSEDRKLNT